MTTTVTSPRTFAAFLNGTGLESVTNRARVKVAMIPGDHTWETQIRVEITPGRFLTAGKLSYPTYTIVVAMWEHGDWKLRVVTGDDPYGQGSESRVLLEQAIDPRWIETYATSFVDIVHEGVKMASPAILNHANAF